MQADRTIALAALLALAACSEPPAPEPRPSPTPSPVAATPTPAPSPTGPAIIAAGYGAIRIGAAPAEGLIDTNDFPDDCRIYTAKKLPDVYAIVTGGIVRRVTFMKPDTGPARYRTDRGIAPGDSEVALRAAYPELVETPHHYVASPAKYLDLGGKRAAPGIRFEVGSEGRVDMIHIGNAPWLHLVEGCA